MGQVSKNPAAGMTPWAADKETKVMKKQSYFRRLSQARAKIKINESLVA